MILKQSRDNKTVATYETEEAAVKENRLSLALLRSHLNSKKPKYLDGFVYAVQEKIDAPDMLTGDPLEGLTEEAKEELVEVPISELKAQPPVIDELRFPAQTLGEMAGLASTINYKAPDAEAYDRERAKAPAADEFPFTQQWTTKEGLETLGVGSVTVRRQSMHYLVETGVNITHTDAEGNQRRVDPTSEEGEKVMELVQGEPLPADFEPSPTGEEQGFDLRTIAKQQLSPDDVELPPVEADFNLTPMQKRAKELKQRPPL